MTDLQTLAIEHALGDVVDVPAELLPRFAMTRSGRGTLVVLSTEAVAVGVAELACARQREVSYYLQCLVPDDDATPGVWEIIFCSAKAMAYSVRKMRELNRAAERLHVEPSTIMHAVAQHNRKNAPN